MSPRKRRAAPRTPTATRVDRAEPGVGDTLTVAGEPWEVTDHSSYWNDAGYRVTEWECEAGDTTGYLLKELAEGGTPKWLFTRQIDPAAVTLPGGGALAASRPQRGGPPPAALVHDGQTYQHAETTEGTYEDDPGEREAKTTWDYWDGGHARNLAIEIWEDGRLDAYLGAYVDPAQVTVEAGDGDDDEDDAGDTPGSGGAAAIDTARKLLGAVSAGGLAAGAAGAAASGVRTPSRPLVALAILVPLVYVIAFFFGQPFDRAMGVALAVAALVAWLGPLFRAPLAALVALALVPVLAALFWRFPPLGSPVGVGAFLASPLLVVGVARARGVRGERAAIGYLAAFAVALPLLVVGLYHYFQFAPGPHGLAQWVLALGPAVLAGVAARLLAALLLVTTGEPDRT
jgi:hypothetical protein